MARRKISNERPDTFAQTVLSARELLLQSSGGPYIHVSLRCLFAIQRALSCRMVGKREAGWSQHWAASNVDGRCCEILVRRLRPRFLNFGTVSIGSGKFRKELILELGIVSCAKAISSSLCAELSLVMAVTGDRACTALRFP